MFRDTELYKHAESELNRLLNIEYQNNLNTPIGELEDDFNTFNGMTPQEHMNNQILDIIAAINSPALSGYSLNYIIDAVCTLCQFGNLTPLELTDSEFDEVASYDEGEVLYQNKRNFKVFKSTSKGIYHIDGKAALDEACGRCPECEDYE